MSVALLQRLIDAGTPTDLVAEVATELAKAEVAREIISNRRAKDRARKVPRNSTESVESVEFQEKVPLEVSPPAPPLPKTLQDISPYNPPNGAENDNPEQPNPEPDNSLKPQHVVDEWNNVAGRCGLAKVRNMDGGRLRKLRARIRDHPLPEWIEVFDAIERTPWMHGDNERGWRIPFDFLLEPTKFNKILEGTYERSNAIQR